MIGKLDLSLMNSKNGYIRFKYSERRWWVI